MNDDDNKCAEKDSEATVSSSKDVSSSVPWMKAPTPRKRKSPLEFELEASGTKMMVVYDSMLNKNMASAPLLKTFGIEIDRMTVPEFVRIPSSKNRFELCHQRIKLPIRIETLSFNCLIFCTTFPEKKLFLGRNFGQKYIKEINVHTNLMKLSDGKSEVEIKFKRLKYKGKSKMT